MQIRVSAGTGGMVILYVAGMRQNPVIFFPYSILAHSPIEILHVLMVDYKLWSRPRADSNNINSDVVKMNTENGKK